MPPYADPGTAGGSIPPFLAPEPSIAAGNPGDEEDYQGALESTGGY